MKLNLIVENLLYYCFVIVDMNQCIFEIHDLIESLCKNLFEYVHLSIIYIHKVKITVNY